jgi:hypothetical protein
MKIELKIDGATEQQMVNYHRIIYALLKVGGLDGVKRGRTVIHFNTEGKFSGIQLDYMPWTEKENLTNF